MQTVSLLHDNQAIIPEQVLTALSLRDGDAIIFEIDQTGVHLRKAAEIDSAFAAALQPTLSEWDSEEDNQAYADL